MLSDSSVYLKEKKQLSVNNNNKISDARKKEDAGKGKFTRLGLLW